MSDTTPEKLDWAAINQCLYERNQQLLRDNAELLKGPAARAIWPEAKKERVVE